MGLKFDVNGTKNRGIVTNNNDNSVQNDHNQETKSTSTKKSVIELFDIPDSDDLTTKKKSKRLPLNEEEQKYVVKCLKKYGGLKKTGIDTDEDLISRINVNDIQYTKMFRDIKVNTMQHTEDKLRKMCSRFLLLDPEQRFA